MKVTVVAGRQLTDDHVRVWSDIQGREESLASPFFRPEFTSLVAATRHDVHVGVLEEGGEVVGFFPFERRHHPFGHPVGGALNESHGVIARAGLEWEPQRLMRACGLIEWSYSHLPVSQTSFAHFNERQYDSAAMDVSRGWEMYVEERRRVGTRQVQDVDALARRLEREVGPLRFEAYSTDVGVLESVIKWKCDRYGALVHPSQLPSPWARALLERIQATMTPAFAGALSALYVGDQLAAAHMGLRSQRVWHYWYPAFNPQFASYSPGLILLLKIAAYAAAEGITRVELGGSDDYLYKRRLMNHAVPLAAGVVDSRTSRLVRSVRRMLP